MCCSVLLLEPSTPQGACHPLSCDTPFTVLSSGTCECRRSTQKLFRGHVMVSVHLCINNQLLLGQAVISGCSQKARWVGKSVCTELQWGGGLLQQFAPPSTMLLVLLPTCFTTSKNDVFTYFKDLQPAFHFPEQMPKVANNVMFKRNNILYKAIFFFSKKEAITFWRWATTKAKARLLRLPKHCPGVSQMLAGFWPVCNTLGVREVVLDANCGPNALYTMFATLLGWQK